MSTCEAIFSSDDSPSIHNSNTHSKSKCSIRSWVAHVKAKCRISKPKLLENNHNTASNNSDNDDHHDGALALSDLIRQDFHFMKEEIAKIKNYVDHVDGQINQAYQNFEELHTRGSREGELHEVKKAVAKLKSRIPSQLRIPSADSNPHRNSWPDINKSSDEMMQLYMVPKSKSTIDSAHLWKAFSDLTALSRYLLLCFFLFPPKAIIKRRDIIYLCISEYFQLGENRVNEVLDRLIGMDFIEPVYQKCSLVPDSCRMPLSVRSALSNKAMTYASTSKYNTDLKLLKTMSISDGKSAPSSSSDETGNPYVNNSSPDEAKFSVRSSGAQYFKSNCRISESESESESESMHKSLEDHHHNSPSSSITTTSKIDDHRLYNLIREDLFIMKKTLAEAKKNVDNMDVQINQANGKFEDLQARGSSERELAEFKVAIVKLKSHIPSQLKIHVNSHRNSWPDINKYSDEMMHLYTEPKFEDTIDSYGLFEAFHGLTEPLQGCLLCFLLFPPEAVIKRKVMIYSWISNERFMNEDIANAILDKFIERGIIEPVCQKCTLVPDSCRMSLSVRSALSIRAMLFGITSKYNTGGITEVHGRYESYLINASESTVGGKLFEKKCIKTLYLGRWQSSATHHIEVADNKVLHGLKNMKQLTFLSLRGISMITELPTFISELTSLKILDLKACHNLEGVPDGIGLLENLTHLDMSECYFIENMPRSLANLSRLKVLKGFFIGDSKNNKRSCTLENLSRLRYLRKLNIYTGVKDFPEEGQLSALQKFAALQNLTISWGGYSSPDGSNAIPETRKLSNKPDLSLPSRLQKLDLQCFHGTSPPSWLRLSNMKELKKLYIKGGQLCNLHKSLKPNASNQCTVEILCLKYLGELKMDWEDLMILFPKLIFLHKVECPKLSNIPCNKSGVWKDKKVVDQAQPAQAKLQQ